MKPTKTTPGLPHFAARGNAGGNTTSPFCLQLAAMALLLLALPAISTANTALSPQLDRAIHAHLETLMRPLAQREHWQGLRITHASSSTGTGTGTGTKTCQQDPVVSGGAADNKRQRLTITCPGQPGWQLQVASEIQLWLPVLVTARAIERGEVISAADVKQQEIDITKAPRGFYHQPEQIIGMGAKRRIRANQLFNPALIALPLAVKRGDKVKIIANRDGITASMSGQAVENGSKGEVIRVKNLSSNKTIEAKVLGTGEVASIF